MRNEVDLLPGDGVDVTGVLLLVWLLEKWATEESIDLLCFIGGCFD
jgi:hypothetical protein